MFRLKELRETSGITLRELSVLLNLTNQAISRYELERTQPSFDTLIKLADYFNVSIDYLLGRTEDVGFSPEEKSHGISGLKSVPLTAKEEYFLHIFRDIGKQKGAELQETAQRLIEQLLD